VLEDFLEKFSGCLLLVSHDRYFMDHLVNQLLVFEGDGKIRLFNGNYTDYRDWLDEEEEMKARPAPKAVIEEKSKTVTASTEKRKASFKEKQEYEKLQAEIDALESKRNEISKRMNDGAADHKQLQEWANEVQVITNQIDEKTLRCLELADMI
jgi:ATP-binding cassette subfamily F protein uup